MVSTFARVSVLSIILIFLFILLSFFLYSVYWLILIGVVIFVHQALYIYGMFSIRSNYFFKTIKGKEFFLHKPGILFRFDDGPDPVYTPQILNILKTESIKALFAITGENAKKYPEIIKRMYRENHIIANHTFSHPFNILLLRPKMIFKEINTTNEIIKNITGKSPVFFCPPLGHKNAIIGKVIKNLNLEPIMWDIRTKDTHVSSKKIIRSTLKKVKPKSIILFHDGIMPLSKKDRESTIKALKYLIKYFKQKRIL